MRLSGRRATSSRRSTSVAFSHYIGQPVPWAIGATSAEGKPMIARAMTTTAYVPCSRRREQENRSAGFSARQDFTRGDAIDDIDFGLL